MDRLCWWCVTDTYIELPPLPAFCSNALQKMATPLTSSKKLKHETCSTKSIRMCMSLTQNLALTQTRKMERVPHTYQFSIPLCFVQLTFISGPTSSLRVSLRWAHTLVLLVLSTNRFNNIPGLATKENGSSALAGRISRNTIFPVFMNKATTGNKCKSSYLIKNCPQDSGFRRWYTV